MQLRAPLLLSLLVCSTTSAKTDLHARVDCSPSFADGPTPAECSQTGTKGGVEGSTTSRGGDRVSRLTPGTSLPPTTTDVAQASPTTVPTTAPSLPSTPAASASTSPVLGSATPLPPRTGTPAPGNGTSLSLKSSSKTSPLSAQSSKRESSTSHAKVTPTDTSSPGQFTASTPKPTKSNGAHSPKLNTGALVLALITALGF